VLCPEERSAQTTATPPPPHPAPAKYSSRTLEGSSSPSFRRVTFAEPNASPPFDGARLRTSSPQSHARKAARGPLKCPASASGSGILEDGDFHLGTYYNPYKTFQKDERFARGWHVTKRTIDLYGGGWPTPGGLCSIDLDGDNVGGIEHAPFATVPNAVYAVTFLFSGNSGPYPPIIKTMKVEAAGQSQIFTWNTASDNYAENGVFQQESWLFTATSSVTRLKFVSLDKPKTSRAVRLSPRSRWRRLHRRRFPLAPSLRSSANP